MRRKLMQNAVPKIRRRRNHNPASSRGNTIRSRKAKPRHKVRRHVDAISNILLIGDSNRVVEIDAILSSLATDILCVKSKEDATSLANDRTLAFIVVEPMDFRSMTCSTLEICEELVEFSQDLDIPILAIISDERQTLHGRALLEAGVAEVFAYPLERFELPRLVSQAIGLASSIPNLAKSDRDIRDAIEEAITSNAEPIGKNIKVAVSDGIVSLYGSLDAYWKMKYMERLAARISNVRAVIASGLSLKKKSETDRNLEEKVRSLLVNSEKLSQKTLDVGVKNGVVQLRGSTEDGREFQQLEENVSQLEKVKSVKATVVVSPEQARRDTSLSESMSQFFASLFPDAQIKVAAFGGIVVLRGRVRSLSEIMQASQITREKSGVRKVVNRLRVHVPASG